MTMEMNRGKINNDEGEIWGRGNAAKRSKR